MEKLLTKNIKPGQEPPDIREYERSGGYEGLRKALKMTPVDVQYQAVKANLPGRGGAGFAAGKKWQEIKMGQRVRHPKYLVVNADEMEPGTMKDRVLMEGDPHQLIEGIVIAGYAVEANVAYIFLRQEYKLSEKRLRKAIAEAYDAGYLGKNILGSPYSLELRIHTSAGRYMCGEAGAMLAAIEGRRAIPRAKPPRAVECGLWGKPTVVNNVETVCCVPHIVRNGYEWFVSQSLTDEGGTKLYGVSGRVKNPGVWELPVGTTAREIIYQHAGGMLDGYRLRGWLPGGASTGLLTEEHLDVPMDFASMEKTGSRLGTGTIVVMDDRSCSVGMMLSLERFFARESCGWCTPCREGLPWVVRTLEALEAGDGQTGDLDVLDMHVKWITTRTTFCALAPGAMMPLEGALKYFRNDYEIRIKQSVFLRSLRGQQWQ